MGIINDENLEIRDGYDVVEQEKVRSIKTREQSFNNILGFWERRKLKKLTKNLEKQKEKLLSNNFKTDSKGKLTSKDQKKLLKATKAVASIEQEIKFLSGEYVPEDSVLSRAIKLKENMEKNLRFNSQNAYSVGLDKYDEIFSEEKKEDTLESAAPVVEPEVVVDGDDQTAFYDENVEENAEVEEIVNDDKTAFYDEVTGEFSDGVADETEFENHLDRIIRENERKIAEDVRAIVDENEKASDAVDIDVVPTEIERAEIKAAVEDVFGSVDLDVSEATHDSSSDDEHEIEADEIEEAIDGAMDEVSVDAEVDYSYIKDALDEAMANVRISKTGTAAKLDKFDENGQVKERDEEIEEKKYDYKPMTDEEIARARENIEFDKYEDLYHNVKQEESKEEESFSLIVPEVKFNDIFKPIKNVDTYENVESPIINFEDEKRENNSFERELPELVPERSEEDVREKDATVTDDEGLHFDYSTATAAEVKTGFDQASSLGEFAELRKRAEELKEKQRQSRAEREAAEKAAEEEARRARENKEAALAKQRDYEKRLEKLRLYTEALAEDCEFNANKAKLANDDAECNKRFSQAQEEKAKSFEDMINEIDSMIGPEATNVRRGK